MVRLGLGRVAQLDPKSVVIIFVAVVVPGELVHLPVRCGQKTACAVDVIALCHSFLVVASAIHTVLHDACDQKVIQILVIVVVLLQIDRIHLSFSRLIGRCGDFGLGFGELFLGTGLLSLLLFLGLSFLPFALFFLLGQVVLYFLVATPETLLHFGRICRKI